MKKSTKIIKMIDLKADKKIPIIGVGGVMNKEDYLEKISSGVKLFLTLNSVYKAVLIS